MKFSIAIPAFKRKYLKEATESCLAQTYQDFEIIVVNDASPEDLDSIVAQFSDSRLRYYKNDKNCGAVDVVDNWNICLGHATGDYLICMGDDDRLMPDCLAEYARLIEECPGLGLYHGQTEIIDDKSCFFDVTAMRPRWESVYSLIWHRWDCRKRQFIGDFLFHVDTLRANGGFKKFPLAWGSDDISAVMAASGQGVANTSKVVFQYRVNPYTISSTGNIDIKMQALQDCQDWYATFFDAHKPDDSQEQAYREACIRIMPKYFLKRRLLTISTDIAHNGFFARSCYWMMNGKKYRVNRKAVVYAMIEAVKCKLSK